MNTNLEKYKKIENKHRKLIDIAINYMNSIKDFEHNMFHVNDVLLYTNELLDVINLDIDVDVCIISAYWHDVGRIKVDEGHEKVSADMLKEEMLKLNYDEEFILKCYLAIVNHKWNMNPTTIEGLVIKDADKLAWLGLNRWMECINNNQSLDSIISLLPKLRNEILYFEESKYIYDRDIIKLVEYLYNLRQK